MVSAARGQGLDNKLTLLKTHMREHLVELRNKLLALDPSQTGKVSYNDFLFTVSSLNIPH
jgi:hypothetical protein